MIGRQAATIIAAASLALSIWEISPASPPARDTAAGSGRRAEGDPKEAILEWNGVMLEAIRKQNSAPGLASRNLAIVHLAVFEALKSAPPQSTEPFVSAGSGSPPSEGTPIDPAGIVSGAASRCAQLLYPPERARFSTLLERWRARASDPIAFAAGERVGIRSADTILTERQSDGSSRQVTYVPSKEPGIWQRTAPKFRPPELPHWKDVTPFSLGRADQFRPPPPPAVDSGAYADELAEVRNLGALDSRSRSADQTEIAHFWACFNYTGTPAGHWNDIATRTLPHERYSVLELARAYALLNVAMADAGIAAWDCKYHYRSWRPVQAIPATSPDASWQSLLEAPPHPEYVSGHSTFSGAGCAALQHLIGVDEVEFEIHSDSLPGRTRRYRSLSQAAHEIGQSRIFGGIHFQSGNREGLKLGSQVAAFVIANPLMRPDRKDPHEAAGSLSDPGPGDAPDLQAGQHQL